jgi:cystathionine gamma-synthase
VLAGIVVTNRQDLAEKIAFIQNATGGVLAPFDSWILIRGIKTLAIRLQQAQTNAAALASWLANHKKIQTVYYPGLSRHPGNLVHKKQASGAGAIVSFRMLSKSLAFNVLKKVKVISFAESLGGVETLITHPACQTHADMPKDYLKANGITKDLLRISVGIEHIDDIIEDLSAAI